MNCQDIRGQLIFYLDGELNLSDTHRIQRHMESCEECSRRADSEGNFREALGRMEYHQAPPGLKTRIRSALEANGRRFRNPFGWLVSRPALGAVVAVLLVALVVVAWPGMRGDGTAPFSLSALVSDSGHLQGELVCAGCAAIGVPIEDQRHCRKFGHVTGLQAADGTVWRFVERPKIQNLLYDPPRRGMRVDVEGKFYQEIQYIDVARVSDI